MQTIDTHPVTMKAMATLASENALLASVLRQRSLEIEGTDIDMIAERDNALCINAENFSLHTDEERAYMLAFMALMILFRYADRRGDRDPFLWNLACCMSTHLALEDLGMTGRPSSVDGLIDETCRNMTAEDIYEKTLEKRVIWLNDTLSEVITSYNETNVVPEEQIP